MTGRRGKTRGAKRQQEYLQAIVVKPQAREPEDLSNGRLGRRDVEVIEVDGKNLNLRQVCEFGGEHRRYLELERILCT